MTDPHAYPPPPPPDPDDDETVYSSEPPPFAARGGPLLPEDVPDDLPYDTYDGPFDPDGPAPHREVPFDAYTGTAVVPLSLWGAPGSGKTTFLAALQFAVNQFVHPAVSVNLTPASNLALKEAQNFRRMLTEERTFPMATAGISHQFWDFTVTEKRRGLLRRGPGRSQTFLLEITDAPGRTYDDENAHSKNPAITHLVNSRGLILLLDPIGELEQRNSFRHFGGVMENLRIAAIADGSLVDGRLPQHLAVCLTKWDDPRVFVRAKQGGFVHTDDAGVPRIADPAAFMTWISRAIPESNLGYIDQALRNNFHPNRVKYFITSSLGVGRVDPEQPGPDDFHRVVAEADDQLILDVIEPMNVVEPLLYLTSAVMDRRR